MKLPVTKVVLPKCLEGQKNGQLAPGLLVECGIGKFKMVAPAARAMKALVAAASAAGYEVSATGTYRSYDQQVFLFHSRYTTTELPGRPTKTWNGTTYWQMPGTAMAAVPGTSNHGFGLAADLALKNRRGQTVSVTLQFVEWLINNAATYGYSAEAQSENWHWRYVAGDKIPAAVLAFEGDVTTVEPSKPTPPAPTPQEGKTYVVQAGDSYWKIAEKTLGSGAKWKRISKLNNDKALKPGDTIRIPA
jgi:nucleoid-associated protein YgaU